MRGCLCLFIIAVAVVPLSARAQGIANYNDIIVGARAATLGGAFTAVADDSTAAYHNPAGLAEAPIRGLSLSVSAYGFQRTTYEGVIASQSESVDLDLDSILFYPGITGYVLPLSRRDAKIKHTAALSVLAPRFFEIEGVESLSLESEGIELDVFESRVQRVLMGGPSWAMRASWFAIGASVFVEYATYNQKLSTAFGVYATDGAGTEAAARVLDFSFTAGSYFGLTGNLGMLFHAGDTTRIGFTMQLPSLRLGGKSESFLVDSQSLVEVTPSGIGDISLHQDHFVNIRGSTRIRTPWVFSFGAAQELGPHMVSADVDVYLPVGSFDFIRGTEPVAAARRPGELGPVTEPRVFEGRLEEPARRLVVNGSLGVDLELTKQYQLMLGAYTDFSNVSDEALEWYPQIQLFGASIGVRRLGTDSELTIGVTGRYGRGNTQGLFVSAMGDVNDVTSDARQWSVSLIIGGSKALQDPEPAEQHPAPAPRSADEEARRDESAPSGRGAPVSPPAAPPAPAAAPAPAASPVPEDPVRDDALDEGQVVETPGSVGSPPRAPLPSASSE